MMTEKAHLTLLLEFNKMLLQTHDSSEPGSCYFFSLSLLPYPSTSNGKQLYSIPLPQRNGEKNDGSA